MTHRPTRRRPSLGSRSRFIPRSAPTSHPRLPLPSVEWPLGGTVAAPGSRACERVALGNIPSKGVIASQGLGQGKA
jgi:hypothetical protein